MKILGITSAPDSGAALIDDNRIVAAANEERFTRVKLHRIFPVNSINYVLSQGNTSMDEIDVVASGAWKGYNPKVLPGILDRSLESFSKNPESKKVIMDRFNVSLDSDAEQKKDFIASLKKEGWKSKKLMFVDHHLSHAYTAFYCSPFKEALVLTIDGRGDLKSLTMSIASESEGIREIDWLSELDSLGYYYGIITAGLGFKPHRHEGKITGLAAYGDPAKCLSAMKSMISWDKERIVSNLGDWYKPFFKPTPDNLAREISSNKREDIAASCQYWLEQLVCNYIKRFLKEYNIGNLCLSGGVFANVKLNQRIKDLPGVENVYIHPHMGDGGVGTGAALYALYHNNGELKRPLKNVYLGPSFSNEEIEPVLKKFGVSYQEVNDKARLAAELLEKNKVVGWFQGRMEYGPRALGNRSILFPAIDPKVNDFLNKRLHRTEFMPFAPVTLFDKASLLYSGWKNNHIASNFMTMCYDCTDKMKDETPAVVHVDGTARPQTIIREDNPDYYDVLNEYYKKTKLASIINTSFNDHEEPIVCSPEDALNSFLKDNVDRLIIGDFLVEGQKSK